ncbi:TetR/AcrR family transcriptional regulator C-terminal ligand-binding domain-containing protein [Acinetobacter calcoaceticus]|uniref:TetR/AcrR family transcriptional regulator n=1 Tax=Acinetobacter calcoaceticus TaxID=471 RepID=UPI002B2E8AFC|nr:TetR/AcrR family transcriptional regulator [Acinetobacter baumannii]
MPNTESEVKKQRRPGGRAERMVTAIHQATYQLLLTTDYENIEIPDIAKLAQVNKTTIYRRWPTKIELILDVVSTRIKADVALPDTGDTLKDLCLFLKNIVISLSSPFTLNLLKASLSHPDEQVQTARKHFWEERFMLAKPLIDRAIQRGELSASTQVRDFFELAAAPIFYRVFITADAISDQDIAFFAQRALSYYHP